MNCRRSFCALIVVCTFLFTTAAFAESAVTVTVDPASPGQAIPSDFMGLSIETERILPNEQGAHYFSPANKPLIATFKTLGVKNLRVGGNTSDRATVRIPVEADVDQLFAFAKAAEVDIIYSLRLKQGNPDANAKMAKYIQDHYKSQLVCFAIGNEPSAYGKDYTYPIYREDWKKQMEAVAALVPDAKFCGANVHQNAEWARQFAGDFASSGRIALITEHFYPGGSAYLKSENNAAALNTSLTNRVPKDPVLGRVQMLSPDWFKSYQKLYDGFVPSIRSKGLTYRLEEVNSFFHGGMKGASDSYASALWSLDFSWWWATHNCAGLNFHTVDARYTQSVNRGYTAFITTSNGNYHVQPISYGFKTFSLGSKGRIVPVNLRNPDSRNLTAHSVLGSNKELSVTLINKEQGSNAPPDLEVRLIPGPYSRGEMILLSAANNDTSADTGITLGDAEIKDDASWDGKWKPIKATAAAGGSEFRITLPSASAAVIKLKGN